MTTLGVSFAVISAFFLAATVTLDKLLLEDYYGGNVRIPWFISSTFGAVLGLIATAVSWFVIGNFGELKGLTASMLSTEISVLGFFDISFALAAVAAGLMTSQILRWYFKSFDQVLPGLIAMVIAATPIFVFATELWLVGEGWQVSHYLSVIIATFGLILYAWTDSDDDESWKDKFKPLVAFMFFSVLFLVSFDETSVQAQKAFAGSAGTAVTAALLPYYFLGYGAAIVVALREDVWKFITRKLFVRGSLKFLIVILGMEIVGIGADFSEAWSLSGITATLVALITGAHVVFVWLSDIYIQRRKQEAVQLGNDAATVGFFKIPTDQIEEIRSPSLQFLSIVLVLAGILLWP